MSPEFLAQVYDHMEWADGLVMRAARDVTENAPDERLHDTLFHLHATQHAFLDVWHEREVVFRKADEFESLAQLQEWALAVYPSARTVLSRISAPDLDRPVRLPWAHYFERSLGGPAQPTAFIDTLFQLASHSTYHRGQANRRIRELGGEPALADYIVWVWLGRPDADWAS